jgi:hypothetical protein
MATDQHPGSDATSITQLVTGIINDARELSRQQLALFKGEFRQEFAESKGATMLLALGASLGGLSAMLLCFGVVLLLAWAVPEIPLWGWFLIGGGVLAAVGGPLFWAGRTKFRSLRPLPDQSVQELRENVQWIMHPR